MRRTTAIVLVLMGGGSVAMLSPLLPGTSQACREARAAQRPDAEQVCRSGSGGSHATTGGSHGGYYGRTGSTPGATAAAASVARGGFGGAGAHAASGS